MRTIVLIDTSVFDEILAVPGKSQDHEGTLVELGDWLDLGASLLLPIATIIETGNHIAQVKGDKLTRALSEKYVDQVRLALSDESPFTATPSFDPDHMLTWVDEFPDFASRKIGMADLSIIQEFHRQIRLFPTRRVVIWSTDGGLTGYDHVP